jgi:hypothetical protein
MNNKKLILGGAKINILYEASRSKDATKVSDILTQRGAVTHPIAIEENPINRKYYGRLYYFTQSKNTVKRVDMMIEALRAIDNFIPHFSEQKKRQGIDYSVWLVENRLKPVLEDIRSSKPRQLKDVGYLLLPQKIVQEPIQEKGTGKELPRSKLPGIKKQKRRYIPIKASKNSMNKQGNTYREDVLIRKSRRIKNKYKLWMTERDRRLKKLYDQQEKQIEELEKEGIIVRPFKPTHLTKSPRTKKNIPIDLPEMFTCSACRKRSQFSAIDEHHREVKSQVIGIMIDGSGIVLPKVRNTETFVRRCPFCHNKVTFTKTESHIV